MQGFRPYTSAYRISPKTLLESVPLTAIQSETRLVRANFLPIDLFIKGKARKVHMNWGGSDVVRELLREPVMFQIGL